VCIYCHIALSSLLIETHILIGFCYILNFFWNNIILINNCISRYCFYKITKLASCRLFSSRPDTYWLLSGWQSMWQVKKLKQDRVSNRLADWIPVGNSAAKSCIRLVKSRYAYGYFIYCLVSLHPPIACARVSATQRRWKQGHVSWLSMCHFSSFLINFYSISPFAR
jgi:hypothetical protein